MSYDTWKSTNPADGRFDPAELDVDDSVDIDIELPEPNDDEVTAIMNPSWRALQAENEQLKMRINVARVLVIAALSGVEAGHSMPFMRLDSLLTGLLAQLGCATCGKKFTRDDANQLSCVRHHGVHAGQCCNGAPWAPEGN